MNKLSSAEPKRRRGGPVILVLVLMVTAILQSGCTRVTYVPISWGMEERVLGITYRDPFLTILFSRYDPDRMTLSMQGKPFNKLLKTDTAKKFQGVYRKDERRIYRNDGVILSDMELRNILVHEMGHHVWVNFLSDDQRQRWIDYLKKNPSQLQAMVRSTYADAKDFDTEDFAYTLEYARAADIRMLGKIGVINENECKHLVGETKATSTYQQHPPRHANSMGISRISRPLIVSAS